MSTRGAYAIGVEKRKRILRAALEVVGTKGFSSASVREIAEAADVSPTSLMHYFGTKDDLFIAILEERDAYEWETTKSGNILDAFIAVVRHNMQVKGLVRLYSQMLAEAAEPDHPAHRYFIERAQQAHTVGVPMIVEGQKQGVIRRDLDPEWIVRTATAVADGLQSAWLLDPTIDMPADLQQFLNLITEEPA